jgi:16S rRNA (guanine527-N7)-methyltransferase
MRPSLHGPDGHLLSGSVGDSPAAREAPPPDSLIQRSLDLAVRFGLPAGAGSHLAAFARILIDDPTAPVGTRDRAAQRVLDLHLADSLTALELDCVRSAGAFIDLGSGAGLPGLPIAIALRDARGLMVEASARRCAFLQRALAACQIANVQVLHTRAEDLARRPGCPTVDLVTARAVAPLEVTLEYAAPLLEVGGSLVVWRGRREPAAERAAARAASVLGLEPAAIVRTAPFDGAQQRHLHTFYKLQATPAAYPRRTGMARKRPLGHDHRSDRPRR